MAPFLKILPCVIVGILLADRVAIPSWLTWVLLATAWGMGWLTFRRRTIGHIYIYIALIISGLAVAQLRLPKQQIPQGERLMLHLRITDNPYTNGRWQQTTARVRYYRQPTDNQWIKVDEKILLSVDTLRPVSVGRELICASWVNPLIRQAEGVEELSGWARLMNVRGIFSRVYLTDNQMVAIAPERPLRAATLAKKWQRAASARLARLDLDSGQLSIATIMATGERRGLPSELRSTYSRIGASHLLAVSGLHVGIVFVLINLLLYPLPLFRRGNIVKNGIAIVAIWAFAAMTGLSPSVMRAALMFTGVQIAIAYSLQRNSVNILLATCTIMLLINPSNLYDVSFQLSALAVLFILMIYRPVYQRFKTRFGVVNFALGATIVGFAATLGTAPLVAYNFSNFPLVGLLANLPIILTAHVIVLSSICWILLPISALAPVASMILGVATSVQNAVVSWFASWPMAALEVSISGECVAIIYAIYGLVFIGLRYVPRRFRITATR